MPSTIRLDKSAEEALKRYLAKRFHITVSSVHYNSDKTSDDSADVCSKDVNRSNGWYKTEQLSPLVVTHVYTKLYEAISQQSNTTLNKSNPNVANTEKPITTLANIKKRHEEKINTVKQYLIFRSFTELVWRQVYAMVSAVHQVNACIGDDSLSLNIIDGEVVAISYEFLTAPTVPLGSLNRRTFDERLKALINQAAWSIKQSLTSVDERVHQVLPVKRRLLMFSLQDIVVSAVASQPEIDRLSLKQYASLWLAPWQSDKDIHFIKDKVQTGQLLPVRKSCCFYFQVDPEGICSNCPKVCRSK